MPAYNALGNEQLSPDDSCAAALTSIPSEAVYATMQVLEGTGDIYWLATGTDPLTDGTDGASHKKDGDNWEVWGQPNLNNFRAITKASECPDGKIQVQYWGYGSAYTA